MSLLRRIIENAMYGHIHCVRCGVQTWRDPSRLCADCYRELRIDDYPPAPTARDLDIDRRCDAAESRQP